MLECINRKCSHWSNIASLPEDCSLMFSQRLEIIFPFGCWETSKNVLLLKNNYSTTKYWPRKRSFVERDFESNTNILPFYHLYRAYSKKGGRGCGFSEKGHWSPTKKQVIKAGKLKKHQQKISWFCKRYFIVCEYRTQSIARIGPAGQKLTSHQTFNCIPHYSTIVYRACNQLSTIRGPG